MILNLTLIILFLFNFRESKGLTEDEEDQDVANKYISKVLDKTANFINEPFYLNNYNLTATFNLLPVKIRSVCLFKDGVATGIKHIERFGNVKIIYNKYDMLIKSVVAMNELTINYNVTCSVLNSKINMTFRLLSDSIKSNMTLKLVRNSNVVSLEDFSLYYFANLRIFIRHPENNLELTKPIRREYMNHPFSFEEIEIYIKRLLSENVAMTLYPKVWIY
ncbi:uncharacterized protein LOC111636476 [Centruroides sculpturatus]|uniref:uncharacterized protein LOC111636476 n=1 Tax=Centruroides sculpturatus TaxID=218467 RepID=UPI000C6D5E30|nr:uncharacterized protein LOC111636476 [Centruroides sculpturatus]